MAAPTLTSMPQVSDERSIFPDIGGLSMAAFRKLTEGIPSNLPPSFEERMRTGIQTMREYFGGKPDRIASRATTTPTISEDDFPSHD